MKAEQELETMKSTLQDGLVDDPSVWRCPDLVPGNWQVTTPSDAADFLVRLSRYNEHRGTVALPFLFRPLAVRRLDLGFAPLSLWQVAMNVDFDVGVLDVVERHDPSWRWFGERDAVETPEERASSSPSIESNRLTLIAEMNCFESLRGEAQRTAWPSPKKVFRSLGLQHESLSEAQAIDCARLCLCLSRRERGRLRAPLAEHAAQPLPEPSCCQVDGVWSATLPVVYERAVFLVTLRFVDGSAVTSEVRRFHSIEPMPSELSVGPVRVSGLTRWVAHTAGESSEPTVTS